MESSPSTARRCARLRRWLLTSIVRGAQVGLLVIVTGCGEQFETVAEDGCRALRFDEPDGQYVDDAAGGHQGTFGTSPEAEFADSLREQGHCLDAIAQGEPSQ